MSREPALPSDCDSIVLSRAVIAHRVAEMGELLAERYADEDLRLITVLRGGAFFLADLMRAVDLPLRVDFLAVAAYTPGGGSVRMTKDLDDDITGAHVILVEDVMDTGLTVNYVLSLLRSRNPASLEVCTLLDKPARRIAQVPIAMTGFEMSDRFLVGYGLDLHGRHRNLPYIAAVRDEVIFG